MKTIFKLIVLFLEATGAFIMGMLSLVGLVVSGFGLLLVVLLMAVVATVLFVTLLFMFLLLVV